MTTENNGRLNLDAVKKLDLSDLGPKTPVPMVGVPR